MVSRDVLEVYGTKLTSLGKDVNADRVVQTSREIRGWDCGSDLARGRIESSVRSGGH